MIRALVALVLLAGAAGAAAQRLPGFNVDVAQTSVSGLSSGASMAVQFEVAHSSIVKGAGVIAGGPYYCAQDNLGTATSVCTCTTLFCWNAPGATDVPALVAATKAFAQRGAIDATSHLHQHRAYLFSGRSDTTVPSTVMRDLAAWYGHFLPAAQVRFVGDIDAGHGMPTASFGIPCRTTKPPYLNDCHYDAAGELLQWIHGSLHAARTGALQGRLQRFDQQEFLADAAQHGLDTSGWIFVPQSCAQGAPCRLHVAFHGCEQGQAFRSWGFGTAYGRKFVDHAGYNAWADTNDILVLYPQAVATPFNPKGCWDWWGYDDADYATRSGRQVAAVRAMVDRIASGRP